MLNFLQEELQLIDEDDSNVVHFPNPKIYKDIKQHKMLKTKAHVWGAIHGKGDGKFGGVAVTHDFGEPVDVDTAHDHFRTTSKHYDNFHTFGAAHKVDIGDYFKEEAPPVKPEDLVKSIHDIKPSASQKRQQAHVSGKGTKKDMTPEEFDKLVDRAFKGLGGDYSGYRKNEDIEYQDKPHKAREHGAPSLDDVEQENMKEIIGDKEEKLSSKDKVNKKNTIGRADEHQASVKTPRVNPGSSKTAQKPDVAMDKPVGPRVGMMGGNPWESNAHEFRGQPEAAGQYDNLQQLDNIVAELLRGESDNE